MSADNLKDEIRPSLKLNNRLRISQYVAMNRVREKGKSLCKLLYKVFKKEYEYDLWLEISPFPTLINLKHFLGGITHCVIVVGKWIFDNKSPFTIPLTQDNLDYCCISD